MSARAQLRRRIGGLGRQVVLVCVLLSAGELSCARNAHLDQQVDRIGQLLIDAEANGALRCAPRQLAVARSQLEFAELEREQGFSSKAEQHLLNADQHAQAALLLSPPDHCRPRSSTEPPSSPP